MIKYPKTSKFSHQMLKFKNNISIKFKCLKIYLSTLYSSLISWIQHHLPTQNVLLYSSILNCLITSIQLFLQDHKFTLSNVLYIPPIIYYHKKISVFWPYIYSLIAFYTPQLLKILNKRYLKLFIILINYLYLDFVIMLIIIVIFVVVAIIIILEDLIKRNFLLFKINFLIQCFILTIIIFKAIIVLKLL